MLVELTDGGGEKSWVRLPDAATSAELQRSLQLPPGHAMVLRVFLPELGGYAALAADERLPTSGTVRVLVQHHRPQF